MRAPRRPSPVLAPSGDDEVDWDDHVLTIDEYGGLPHPRVIDAEPGAEHQRFEVGLAPEQGGVQGEIAVCGVRRDGDADISLPVRR